MSASARPINIPSVFDNLKIYVEINTPSKKNNFDRKYPNKSKNQMLMGARAKNSMHNAGMQTSMTNLFMAKAAVTSKVRICQAKAQCTYCKDWEDSST